MRRLEATRAAPDLPDRLAGAAERILDRRLLRDSERPVAVAFSGGGDSLALLLIARAWARRTGRPLLVLTVDHGLQAESARWTQSCAATAARLGLPFQALPWEGPKPAHGLPAAARTARHRLLAEAARAAGARVVLIGHTADDVLEAEAMRAAGSTTPSPREWTPSPAWPEGRGVFLLRPLLCARRADIRAWLEGGGEHWLDDPANDDPTYARARARKRLQSGDVPSPFGETTNMLVDLCASDRGFALHIPRMTLRGGQDHAALRLLSLAAVCAGGGDRRPATPRLLRLLAALRGEADFTAPLAGARVEAEGPDVHLLREAGEAARGGLAPVELRPGEAVVWDGRFELTATTAGTVRRLAGLARQLPQAQQRALASVRASARPALPVVVTASGAVSCPLLAPTDVAIRALTHERLVAAAGLVAREPA